jgi:hypothetical protein
VLNVTVIASAVGHWVAFPSGATMPPTANLNSIGPFHLAANQVIVPVDGDGDFQLYATGGDHVGIDMIGVQQRQHDPRPPPEDIGERVERPGARPGFRGRGHQSDPA